MAEIFQGKIINDSDVSLPKEKDYYYNSINPFVEKDKVTAESFRYIETPPGGESAIGAYENFFIIHCKKDAVDLSDLAMFTGSVDGDTISLDMSKCNVGTVEQDIEFFKQFTSRPEYASWIDSTGITVENPLMYLRFMFCNAGEIPHFTLKHLPKRTAVGSTTEDANWEYLRFDQLNHRDSRYTYTHYKPDIELCEDKVFDKNPLEYGTLYQDGNILTFYKYKQAFFYKNSDVDPLYGYYLVLAKDDSTYESISGALKIRDLVYDAIKKSTDMRICISTNVLNSSSRSYLGSYNRFNRNETLYEIKNEWADFVNTRVDNQWFRYTGYNMYGQELYNRDLAVIYLKVDLDGKGEQWINLNKYTIYEGDKLNSVAVTDQDVMAVNEPVHDNSVLEEDRQNYVNAVEVFKPWSYDIAKANYIDNWTEFVNTEGQDARRKKIQERCFKEAGYHLCGNDLYDWTVSIGDVTFFVPPTAIQMVSETNTERLPVLRAKGSMAKNIEKSDSQLQISLFFNRDIGINGLPVEMELWEKTVDDEGNILASAQKSEDKMTYHMNGLRALISEFKFTPMLPIVNKHINEVLNVFAVSLERLEIATVPDFPRLIQAVLILKKFDYNVYMPEIPAPYYKQDEDGNDTDELINPFSHCINYDVMRYYIQKPLIRGNELAAKLKNTNGTYTVNSLDFMHDTLASNRTALMPCDFLDPNIDIYVADENYLNSLLSIKRDAIQRRRGAQSSSFVPTSIQENVIRDLGYMYGTIIKEITDKYIERRNKVIQAIKKSNEDTWYNFELDLTDEGLKKYEIKGFTYLSDKAVEVFKEIRDDYIVNPMVQELKTRLDGYVSTSIENMDLVNFVQRKSNSALIGINTDYVLNRNDIIDLIHQFGTTYQTENGNTPGINFDSLEDDVFADNELKFNLGNWGFLNNPDWYREVMNPELAGIDLDDIISSMEPNELDLDFLQYLYSNSEALLNANQEAEDLKEAMDWESERSLKFDLVGENIRVTAFSAYMMNNFSRISVLDSDGFAPQYMGSQDIHISWTLETKDENFASIMRGLPEYEAYCLRKFHLVMPCFPIRIDSEFTRMLGVYEVSIESVVVSTVPNFPDLYSIQVRAISVDRTLRNRETLESLANQEDKTSNNDSGELNDYQEVSTSAMATQVNIYRQADLTRKLAKAELYPDLELPKISELGKLKFRFIRYKDKERDADDLYVDPDFYYFYPYTLKSEIIKAAVVATYGEKGNPDKEVEKQQQKLRVSDLTGAKAEIDFWSHTLDLSNANEKAKQNVEDKVKAVAHTQQNEREERNYDLAKILPTAIMGDTARWDVSAKISASYLEKYYLGLVNELNNSEDSINEKTDMSKEKMKNLKEFYDNKMSTALTAAKELRQHLENTPIDTSEGTITDWWGIADSSARDHTETIEDAAEDFFNRYISYFRSMSIVTPVEDDDVEENKEAVIVLCKAVAAANTADYEYNSNLDTGKWMGCLGRYFGIYKDNNNILNALSEEKIAPEKLIYSSVYNIPRLTATQVLEYLGEGQEYDSFKIFYDNLIKNHPEEKYSFVLDPYYRKHPELTDEYLRAICINQKTATEAYLRIVLWWLLKLYDNKVYPSIGLDVMRKNALNAQEAKLRAQTLVNKEYGANVSDVDEDLISQVSKFAQHNGKFLDNGKFFTAAVLSLYNQPPKKNEIYNLIAMRDYSGLNAKLRTVCSNTYKYRREVYSPDATLRKFMLALVGYELISGVDYINMKSEVSPASKYFTNHNTKIALEAATDPKKYMFHSFYDMCRNDYRGRMLRAFPTFYCIFVDEGREIGIWKLYDNFYSMNSIYDITVVKSREIAADTCTLTLSNNYSTFVTDDEDGYINFKGVTIGELWDNLMENRNALDSYLKKRLAANRVNKAKMQPGIRIHIREGYGSDARELGTVFNGVIAQVQPGAQSISVVAQGNGIELMNPIQEERDADEIQFQDVSGDGFNETAGGGATPRKILESFLTTKGDALTRYVHGKYSNEQTFFNNEELGSDEDWTDGITHWLRDIWSDNPYGIHSFGDPDFKDIFPEGEVVQNLYEIDNYPNMDQDGMDLYAGEHGDEKPPMISFETRGKTLWDIMHICQSVAPDYITSIVDFGFRSSIFLGKPHYYYAYDYIEANDTLVERRKPFQQFHIYYSDSDIMKNSITASNKYIATVATGLYQDRNVLWTRNRDVGPLYVDRDIYPEKQKSTVVDTRLKLKDQAWSKSTQYDNDLDKGGHFLGNGIGNILNNIGADIATISDLGYMVGNLIQEYTGLGFGENEYVEHKKIAWSVTANALKDSIKQMYQGGITVIGDPTVKPFDRIFINDIYNDMSGQVLVRDVVHSINAQTGFTTTIGVDCISTVDDRDELYKQSDFGNFIRHVGTLIFIAAPLGVMYRKGIKITSNLANKIGAGTANIVSKIFKNGASIISKSKVVGAELSAGITGGAWTAVKTVAKRWLPALIIISAAEAISYNFNQYLYWGIKNSQVLTIFPLKKNGMVYTSGLDGSLGAVYGSPTFGDMGFLDEMINKYIAPSTETITIGSVIQSLFFDEDVMNEAAKRKRDFRYYNQAPGDNPIGNEAMIESTTFGIMEKPEFHYGNNTYGKSLLNRANLKDTSVNNQKLLKTATSRYYVEDIEKLLKQKNKKNHLLIRLSTDLKPFIGENSLLEILHDNLNSSNTNVEYQTYSTIIDGKQYPVNAIKERITYNNKTYDIVDVPYLTKDALLVLKEICLKAREKLNKNNPNDSVERQSSQNGTKIVLVSALRIGSPFRPSSSGLAFTIRGTGKLSNTLKQMVQDIWNDRNDKLKEVDEDKFVMFNIEKTNEANEVRITINPVMPATLNKKKEDTTTTTTEGGNK